jgi:hypothetical protein
MNLATSLDLYVITCHKLSSRLVDLSHVWEILDLEPIFICAWDSEVFTNYCPPFSYDLLWHDHLSKICNVLIANAMPYQIPYSRKLFIAATVDPTKLSWLQPQSLSLGQLSVLYKHYHAICSIANSVKPYGLIIEDDVRSTSSSRDTFIQSYNEFVECDGDYLDLAGGAGLFPDIPSLSNSFLTSITPARTRTNAAYVVSRRFAIRLSILFFPFVFPIDWHLQYLFSLTNPKCFWPYQSPLIHGSEEGIVTSWRD